MELNIKHEEVNQFFRMGKKGGANQKRPIMLKMVSYWRKMEILHNTAKLKGTKVFLAQDLTPEEQNEKKRLLEKVKEIRNNGKHAVLKGRTIIVEGKVLSETENAENMEVDENGDIVEQSSTNSNSRKQALMADTDKQNKNKPIGTPQKRELSISPQIKDNGHKSREPNTKKPRKTMERRTNSLSKVDKQSRLDTFLEFTKELEKKDSSGNVNRKTGDQDVSSRIANPTVENTEETENQTADITQGENKQQSDKPSWDVLTYNCRTLREEVKLTELLEELQTINWKIVGLSEVKRKGEQCEQLEDGNVFYYNGQDKSEGGTGFLINKNIKNNIIEYRKYTHRVCAITEKRGKHRRKYIQVYAPTTQYNDLQVEEFYEDRS